MSTLKRFLILILALAGLGLAPAAHAQSANFTYRRTLASATRTYCKMTGQLGDPFQTGISGNGLITTSGSSTTVTAATSGAFFPLKAPTATVGSAILVSLNGGSSYTLYRVTAKASDSSITIDTAINIGSTGVPWAYYNEACGTTDSDGWIASFPGDLVYAIYQGGSGTATATVECRGSGGEKLPVQVYPDNSTGAASRSLTAADINSRFIFALTTDVRCSYVRVGFAGTNPVVSSWIERIK